MNSWIGRNRRSLVFLIVTVISSGCGDRPVAAPTYQPGPMADKALHDYDKNKNGQLDEDELKVCPALAEMAKTADTSGDKRLDRDELVARFEAYRASKVALNDIRVRVYRGTQPVPGAVVRLIPEDFMLGVCLSAEGTTIENGEAAFRPKDVDRPGASYGCYRVEVAINGKAATRSLLGKEVYGASNVGEWAIDLNK